MTDREGWDAAAALAACPVEAFEGRLWRMHKRRYEAADPGGARLVSGRNNLGLDRSREGDAFAALYLATAPEICLGEIYRHITPELLPSLNDFRLSELQANIQKVADCRDPSQLGLAPGDLSHDTDYRATQALGAAAAGSGLLGGLLVPSATGLGDNLILFPQNLLADSRVAVISSRDPRLYVGRD
ncbi:MAG: RES family NAD+ phosphorylase [Rubrobacteraceae bacterium]|nr:RES family NAD+ phosphorylase [Rubrobacteraceae bacterium]